MTERPLGGAFSGPMEEIFTANLYLDFCNPLPAVL